MTDDGELVRIYFLISHSGSLRIFQDYDALG
jgi:hypothetical protein